MKKLLTLLVTAVLALTCSFGLVGCGDDAKVRTIDFSMGDGIPNGYFTAFAETVPEDFKIGFIFLHDEKSTYDLNFYNGAKEAAAVMGLKEDQVVYKFNIAEDQACYDTAKDMVDAGCKAIFADSFGHGSYMAKAAKDFDKVQFFHATGTGTSIDNPPANLHNAFAEIYVGRYLGGVAAGMKLNEMIENKKITAEQAKVGYVGAYPYAEVKSGYTSFFLGVKSVCPTATMSVKFTNSWYDEVAEKSAAETLITEGCVLISQHADSMGAPTACEKAGVPNVSYNGSTIEKCPNTFIISSKIDWAPYFKAIIASFSTEYAKVTATDFVPATDSDQMFSYIANDIKKMVGKDFCGDLYMTGSVKMSAINADVMAKGTSAKLASEIAMIMETNPAAYIFNCNNFTVKNAKADTSEFSKAAFITMDADGHLTSYTADVKDEINDKGESTFVPETEVILDANVMGVDIKYFAESKFRSAPYFDIDIDGITIIG